MRVLTHSLPLTKVPGVRFLLGLKSLIKGE